MLKLESIFIFQFFCLLCRSDFQLSRFLVTVHTNIFPIPVFTDSSCNSDQSIVLHRY